VEEVKKNKIKKIVFLVVSALDDETRTSLRSKKSFVCPPFYRKEEINQMDYVEKKKD
jgi:hypothetical protein